MAAATAATETLRMMRDCWGLHVKLSRFSWTRAESLEVVLDMPRVHRLSLYFPDRLVIRISFRRLVEEEVEIEYFY